MRASVVSCRGPCRGWSCHHVHVAFFPSASRWQTRCTMANCGKVEKSAPRQGPGERASDFPLSCKMPASAPDARVPVRGVRGSAHRIATSTSPGGGLRAVVARPARLCAVRVRAPAPRGRRNRFCASHVVFKWKVPCTFGKLTPLWTLVRGTSVESRSPSRAAV